MNKIKATIARVIFEKSDEVTFILSFTGILMALGFLLGDSSNNNYQAINALAPFGLWSLLFFAYGVTKLVSLFRLVSFGLCLSVCALGLWAWSYIFLSFTLFDSVPMTATEILLIVPLLAEIWVLASLIYQKGHGQWK